jgi:molybdopterin synthase sulfur carrier subunit
MDMSNEICITVKLFAIFQETIGQSAMELSLPAGTTVVGAFDRIASQYPDLEPWRSLIRYAVNLDFAAPDIPLQDGDEVAFIPPVSGG